MKYFWFVLFLWSCGSDTAVIEEKSMCIQASEHIASCGIEVTPLPADCDLGGAAEILDISCAELNNPGKADFFSKVLCRTGLLYTCDVDECIGVQPDGFTQWGDCADLLVSPVDSDCRTCDYYRCKADQREEVCTDVDYYIDFGQRYCHRFAQLTEGKLSTAGQEWSHRVRICLMQFVEDNLDETDTCRDIKQEALTSHEFCYETTGFCELPLTDWLKILTTVDPFDVDLKSVLLTGLQCLKSYSDENPGILETDLDDGP